MGREQEVWSHKRGRIGWGGGRKRGGGKERSYKAGSSRGSGGEVGG